MSNYTKGIDETEELRSTKLSELAVALDKLPLENKVSYVEAQSKCPHLLDSDFHLLFLRCERWNVELAVTRVTKYWDERVALFGPTKAFEPLTVAGALRDDHQAASLGIFNILPGCDADGRSVVWVDASAFPDKNSKEVTRESMCRFMWYAFHAALENENAQKHGVVTLFYNRNPMRLNQFDRKRTKLNVKSMKGCLPVRLKAIMLCQPPSWFSVAWPLIQLFLGERLRQRVSLHKGSTEQVLHTIQKQGGLRPEILPRDIGGHCVWDPLQWFETRQAQGL